MLKLYCLLKGRLCFLSFHPGFDVVSQLQIARCQASGLHLHMGEAGASIS